MIKIVTLGGAGGQSNLLKSLVDNHDYVVTAICTPVDCGGDTGNILKEYRKLQINGSFPDVGKCLCALSSDRQWAAELTHRFSYGSREGQSLKNSLYLALIQRYGLRQGLIRMHQVCKVPDRHRVLPASFARSNLRFRLADGTRLSRETVLDLLSRDKLWNLRAHRVTKVWLSPSIEAEAEALQAINQADWIIISPGDLFTSIIPVLLVNGIGQAVAQCHAKLMMVMNLMTKVGETDGFNAADFIRRIRCHTNDRVPDVAVCNSNGIPEESLRRYRRKEHKVAVVANSLAGTEFEHEVKLVSADLWAKTSEGYIVHDPLKLAAALKPILV